MIHSNFFFPDLSIEQLGEELIDEDSGNSCLCFDLIKIDQIVHSFLEQLIDMSDLIAFDAHIFIYI